MLTEIDDKDSQLITCREAARDRRSGPRLGDYLIHGSGFAERFCHDWGDEIQTTEGGSFHLFEGGGVSFSGGLNQGVPKAQLVDTGEMRPGCFWIFHHNQTRAHNGVRFQIPCRVYRLAVDPAAPVLRVSWVKGTEAGELLTRCPVEARNVATAKRMAYFTVTTDRPFA